MKQSQIKPGLDRVLENPKLMENWGSLALVTHAATATLSHESCPEAIVKALGKEPSRLKSVYGPQHGYWQCEPYNMFETPDSTLDLENGGSLPLYSLYGEAREPKTEHLQNVDTIVVDLPDIGCRIYTYMTTLAGCLNQAAKLGKRVVVLDRPNPLGLSFPESEGNLRVEGNVLEKGLESFVGWFRIPFRHGLTLGELGNYYIDQEGLEVHYEVVTVDGLERKTSTQNILRALPRMASPNMPTPFTMQMFPVCVALEGTNISEGRGSTAPFHMVGAPFLKEARLQKAFLMATKELGIKPCVRTRPYRFQPSFDKFSSQICHGIYLDEHQSETASSHFETTIALLAALSVAAGHKMTWREKGYEYNFEDNPLDLILGNSTWRGCFEQLQKLSEDSSLEFESLDAKHESAGRIWSTLRAQLQTAKTEASSFEADVRKFYLYS